MGARLSYPEVDLKDKVAIVTGGNTGIGYETVKAFAFMGAHTILACRSEERGQQAVDHLKEEGRTAGKEIKVELMKLDLSSLQSTKQFIEDFKQKNLPLHLLICNAGIGGVLHGKTEDNLELHFQVNHLGHLLICLELLPCMMNTDGDKRIVIVSSRAAKFFGVWDPSNLQGDTSYGRAKFYGNSKLYNIMTMYALQRRIVDCGITVSSLHPGTVNTELVRYTDDVWYSWAIKAYFSAGRTPQQGAVTTINCAVNLSLNSQQAVYYNNCRPEQAPIAARNEQYQEELWRISCDLLKDWMSPEIWSKYSPSTETTSTAAKQDSGNNDGDDQPTTTENKPVADGDKPVEKPVEDGDRPVEDGDKPVEKPVEDGDGPVEDGDKPAEDGEKPVDDGDKSMDNGDKPSESENQ
ncbi:retinol dehydrogenase 11-like isoform X2 [Dysidea avara]|uniref:retinol dehydrogenase 11-like isoform X2 n=1 Tax=Dysidea avara TaxID=196820 RepID=UPI00331A3EAC